jgi:hypothetical protein
MSDCSVGTARRHSCLIRSPWHIIVALVAAVAPVFAGPEVATRRDQGSAEQRWKDVSYVAGTGSLRPAQHGDACDLVLQEDRLVIRPSSTEWKRCSVAGTEIRGDAITWLGYARGSGSRSSGLGGPLDAFVMPLGPSHLIAIGFRDSTGAEGSATFSYYSRLRGADGSGWDSATPWLRAAAITITRTHPVRNGITSPFCFALVQAHNCRLPPSRRSGGRALSR